MKWYGLLYHLFFKGCFPQISLGPFLNTSSHIWFMSVFNNSVGVWNFSFYINLQKKAPIFDNLFWKQLRKSTNSGKILPKINTKMFRQHNTINIIVSMESYETLPRKYTQQSIMFGILKYTLKCEKLWYPYMKYFDYHNISKD